MNAALLHLFWIKASHSPSLSILGMEEEELEGSGTQPELQTF
jgi:hypothetical protein